MPILPPNNLNDLPRAVRAKVERLFFERSVLQYAFSFEHLAEHMSVADMQQCIVAFKEEDAKTIKSELNDKITAVYTEHGIEKTLRHMDPFGREKDFIMMEGVSTSFSKERALQIAVAGILEYKCPECRGRFYLPEPVQFCPDDDCNMPWGKQKVQYKLHTITAEVFTAILQAATTQSKYTTLQARDVKKEEETNGKPKGKR